MDPDPWYYKYIDPVTLAELKRIYAGGIPEPIPTDPPKRTRERMSADSTEGWARRRERLALQ